MEKGRILLIEDDPQARYALRRVLESEGFEVDERDRPVETDKIKDYDLLILDLKLENESGLDYLTRLKEEGKSIPVVVITAYASPENIITASRYGAIDILKKPFDRDQLLELVYRVVKREEKRELKTFGSIIGQSEKMLEVFKKIGLAASNDLNVLLLGETGTGKDLVAKVIHENSPRRDKPFVAINCSAIPENLLEAELFGYRKGAFTGAIKDTPGKIEAAEGGTLFLDEIGDLPLPLQAKLLRFLEDRTFYRIGEEKERKADVRVIAATNRNLSYMIDEGRFREDLYYRLAQILIELPPLRERKEDIPLLMEHFLRKANEEFGTNVQGFSKEALKEALSYRWKGNIRELKNVVYKNVLETKEGVVKKLSLSGKEGRKSFEEWAEECINNLSEEELKGVLDKFEKVFIKKLLERYQGNRSKVARLLGISRNTLRSKLREV